MNPTVTGEPEEPAAPPETATPTSARWKQEVFAYLELFALCGLLFAQPMLDSVRRNSADVLLSRHATAGEVLLAVATIVFVPAAVLWAIEFVVGLVAPPARRGLHAFFLGALTATFVFGIAGRQSGVPDWLVAILAGVAGIAMGALVLRFAVARTYLRFLSIAPIVFAVLFLTGPVVGPIVTGGADPAAADVVVRHPQRVMLIVLDEFPTRSLMDGTGHVDARLYPNFAALAGRSTWYRNATSVAPYTKVAVPAIADGNYPEDPAAFPTASAYPDTVFTLLGKQFRMNVHEAHNESICPQSLCPQPNAGATRGILRDAADFWQTQTLEHESTRPLCACDDSDLTDGLPAAQRFLTSLGPSSGPQLDYVHVILPHAPWHLLQSGQDYNPHFQVPTGLSDAGTWSTDEWAEIQHHRHLLQLQYVDAWLGKVMDRLKAMGEYDDTSIVVTADHGVTFAGTVPYRVPVKRSFSDILWVPLFVKQAGQADGRVDDRPASTIDVLPTIADLVGTKLPWKVDGRSVLGTARTDPDPKFLAWPSRSPFLAPSAAVYQRWSGPRGLARVLATPATNPDVSGDLALFGVGQYAGLVGRSADAIVDRAATGPQVIITNGPSQPVDPFAHLVPWADVKGGLSGKQQFAVAYVLNGTIAAVGPTQPGFVNQPVLRAVIPPALTKPGLNDLQLYVVDGPASAPRLIPVKRVG